MKNIDNTFYVYIYLDPRKEGNFKYGCFEFSHEPFYVGKGHKERMYEHLYNFSLEKYKHTYRIRKIKKIINLGYDLKDGFIIKIADNLLNNDSCEFEINLIKIIGRKDLGYGPLTNTTDGGEGVSGRVVNEQTKKKMSESQIGKKHNDKTKTKIGEYFRNRPSPKKGKKLSEKQKLNAYKFPKGNVPYNKGITLNVASRKKLSEAHIKNMKININERIIIIEKYKNGKNINQLSKEYDVDYKVISKIIKNNFY